METAMDQKIEAFAEAQGFTVQPDGTLVLPEDGHVLMEVPGQLVPTCPHCGRPATMNLRADATFVEDEGWHEASARYGNFLRTRTENGQKVLFLELGVGYNTPIIIKYPFWQMTARNGNAVYGSVNRGEDCREHRSRLARPHRRIPGRGLQRLPRSR